MAINPNTDFTSGAVLTNAQQNRFPRGVMANAFYAGGNTTSPTTPTVNDVVGATGTFTAVANRTYKVTWMATGQKLTTAGWTAVYVTNSANTIFSSTYATAAINGYFNLSGICYFSNLAAGAQTLKLRTSTENASATILASGGNPVIFMIEDCGPS